MRGLNCRPNVLTNRSGVPEPGTGAGHRESSLSDVETHRIMRGPLNIRLNRLLVTVENVNGSAGKVLQTFIVGPPRVLPLQNPREPHPDECTSFVRTQASGSLLCRLKTLHERF